MTVFKYIRLILAPAFAALMTLSFAPDEAFAEDPNIDIYAQLPRTQSVRVSPDGKHIAMLAPFAGDKAVFVYDLINPDAKTVIVTPPENSIVKAIDWASNKHVIMLARVRGNGEGKMKHYSTLFSRWVSTNIETERSVILLDDVIKSKRYRVTYGGGYVHDLPDNEDEVLMSFTEYGGEVFQRHYRVDLDSGNERLERSMPATTGNVVLSNNGETVLAREDYDPRNGQYEVFFGEGIDEESVYKKRFDKSKNRTTYLSTVLNGKLLMQETEQNALTLFTIDPATKSATPFTFEANVPDGYDYGPIFDNQTGKMIGVSYTDDRYRQVYTEEPYKSWHDKFSDALEGQNVTILSKTEDNKMVTIYAENDSNPGEYFLYEEGPGTISSLGGTYPELKASQIGSTMRADYTARDGLNIPAYLTLPPGKTKADGPFPTVVMPHGGPTARDDATFDFWGQYLAAQGYAVFKPQFRGSTGFGYEHLEKGYGEFGRGMLHDTIDGVNHYVDNNVINPDKICVTGASYGGYQALALPVMEPDMFKCALSVNGVSQIRDILKFEEARTGRESGVIKFWQKIIGDRYDDKDMLLSQSPAENAEKIKAEIVLVHGTDDMTVPLQQSEVMAKALKKRGQSDDILLLPNDDHNLSLPISRKKLLEASDELFEKHLK